MSASQTVTTTPSDAHVEVRLAGQVLATDRALRLTETGLPDRWYLPQEGVRMDLLRTTTFETTCPFKGQASYWSVDLGGTTYDGIVWVTRRPSRPPPASQATSASTRLAPRSRWTARPSPPEGPGAPDLSCAGSSRPRW